MLARVKAIFDEATCTISYVVAEPDGQHCAVIDSVLNFDPKSGRTSTTSADEIIAYVEANSLNVDWILETHPHADHLTAAPYLQEHLGGEIAIGEHVCKVQEIFSKVFNVEPGFTTDGSQFDRLLKDGESIQVGGMTAKVIHTPGHTPACVTYIFGDAAFVGDTIFMPDSGTGRTDFPGGDSVMLYRSIRSILALPPETTLFMCHDYGRGGREFAWETTVADELADNIHINDGIDEEEFVKFRRQRNAVLEMPKLLLPSVQVNMRAGHLPPPEANNISYLKLPVNAL